MYNIIKISQNTEKNPGDQRRLAVTQTPVENYQLMVVWKTHKGNRISPNSNTKQRHKNQSYKSENQMQHNSRCRLCGERDETTARIISECCKLAQKEYKARHNLVGKVFN